MGQSETRMRQDFRTEHSSPAVGAPVVGVWRVDAQSTTATGRGRPGRRAATESLLFKLELEFNSELPVPRPVIAWYAAVSDFVESSLNRSAPESDWLPTRHGPGPRWRRHRGGARRDWGPGTIPREPELCRPKRSALPRPGHGPSGPSPPGPSGCCRLSGWRRATIELKL